MSHLTYAEQTELELRAAMRDYNKLYPHAPIRRIGDTPDRIWHLLDWDQWRGGLSPLDPSAITAIERRVEDIEGFS